MLESAIQTKIKNQLEKDGWYVVKIITCSKNGWPDLQAMKDNKIRFIEVKQPGKKPTALQTYMHQKLRSLGFTVIVAQGVEDVKGL